MLFLIVSAILLFIALFFFIAWSMVPARVDVIYATKTSYYIKNISWCSPAPFGPLIIFHWYNYFLDLDNGRQTSFTTMVCPGDGIYSHCWFYDPNDCWCSWLFKARAESAITQWEAGIIKSDKEVQPSKFSINVQTFCASLSKTSSANRP